MNDYEDYAILTNTPWIFGTSKLSHLLVGENLPPDAFFYQAALLQQDFLSEGNSVKAVQFVNEMVTDALRHVEDSLEFSSRIQDPGLFRFHALPRILSMASVTSCYNNVEVFRKDMRENLGVRTKLLHNTRSMADVYSFYYNISCTLQSKVDNDDPHATETKSILESIKQKCTESENVLYI
nr:PREDICTED: squalene synthase-like [Daucus carota subsp. sativus]